MFDEAFKHYLQYAKNPTDANRDRVYAAFQEAVIAYARRRLSVSGAQTLGATDVVINAFLVLDQEALLGRKFASPEDMQKHALAIIRNAHIDYARSKSRRQSHMDSRPLEDVQQEDTKGRQAFDSTELIIQVDAAIEDLRRVNPRAAEMAQHYVYGRHTYAEIAEIFGVHERTVRNAIAMLRVRLKANGMDTDL